jgi:hypothetical protein
VDVARVHLPAQRHAPLVRVGVDLARLEVAVAQRLRPHARDQRLVIDEWRVAAVDVRQFRGVVPDALRDAAQEAPALFDAMRHRA